MNKLKELVRKYIYNVIFLVLCSLSGIASGFILFFIYRTMKGFF